MIVRRVQLDVTGAAGPSVGRDVGIAPLREEMVRATRPALLLIAAATGLVVLIACVNAAGLLLARGVTRRRESAVRAALGAGRGRVARLLVTESVVLTVAGGAVGLAVAASIVRALPALMPGYVPRLDEAEVDGRVVAFAIGLSVVVGLLAGAAPALRWLRFDLLHDLSEGGQAASGARG